MPYNALKKRYEILNDAYDETLQFISKKNLLNQLIDFRLNKKPSHKKRILNKLFNRKFLSKRNMHVNA